MIGIPILSLLLAIACGKVDNISIPQAGCSFMVDSNSTGFNFQTCSTPTNAINSDWSQCIAECCPGQSASDLPSLNALVSCKQRLSLSQSLSLTSIIVFTVLAIIVSTIFVCFCGIVIKLLKSMQRNRVGQ
jgi:hypothetical protein